MTAIPCVLQAHPAPSSTHGIDPARLWKIHRFCHGPRVLGALPRAKGSKAARRQTLPALPRLLRRAAEGTESVAAEFHRVTAHIQASFFSFHALQVSCSLTTQGPGRSTKACHGSSESSHAHYMLPGNRGALPLSVIDRTTVPRGLAAGLALQWIHVAEDRNRTHLYPRIAHLGQSFQCTVLQTSGHL